MTVASINSVQDSGAESDVQSQHAPTVIVLVSRAVEITTAASVTQASNGDTNATTGQVDHAFRYDETNYVPIERGYGLQTDLLRGTGSVLDSVIREQLPAILQNGYDALGAHQYPPPSPSQNGVQAQGGQASFVSSQDNSQAGSVDLDQVENYRGTIGYAVLDPMTPTYEPDELDGDDTTPDNTVTILDWPQHWLEVQGRIETDRLYNKESQLVLVFQQTFSGYEQTDVHCRTLDMLCSAAMSEATE